MVADTAWFTLIRLFSTGVSIACQILVLVIVAGAVRRNRPDAYGGLLTWAIVSLVAEIVVPLLYTVMGIFASSGGLGSLVVGQGVVSAITAVIHIVLAILLVRALVRLAQPPKAPNVNTGTAYR